MNCDGSFRSCHGNGLSKRKTYERWSGVKRQGPSSRTWGVLVRANAKKCRVVFVTTEVAPWSKVGGLGDVMAALPAALAARGHRVMTVSPMYSNYSNVRDTGVRAPVQLPFDAAAAAAAGQQQLQQEPQQQRQEPAQGAADEATQKAAATYVCTAGPGDDGVAKAAAIYERAEITGDVGPSAGVAVDSSNYVRFYMCCSSGVDRVFVQHPLYHGDGRKGAGDWPWPAAILSSYCHPEAPGHAGAPDLAAAASVLCQAALAAPLLLWGVTRGLHQQLPQQAVQQQGMQGHAHQQQLEMRLLLRLLGLEHNQAAAVHAAGMPGQAAADVATLLKAATHLQQAELARGMQYPQQILSGRVQPVLLGTGGSEVDRRWPVCDLLQPCSQQHSHQSSSSGWDRETVSDNDSSGPLLFVANDWPCGVLPMWLDAYRQEAQQQWQQQNPHLDWLREQQHAVFHLQQQQQQPPQEITGLVQAAVEAGGSRGNQGESKGVAANTPGSDAATAAVFEDYAAVYVNGMHLGNPAVEAQQVLQELQQDWQQPARAESSDGGGSNRPGEQAVDIAADQQHTDSLAGSSVWSAAAEAWLIEVGYQPESVYDADLAALVSSAIAEGRVASSALPALTAAQAQLQHLLQQEQALGEAIQRLTSATIQLQDGCAEARTRSNSSRAAMYAAAAGGARVRRQQRTVGSEQASGSGAEAQPVHLSHSQERVLLQQLLGRQLGDAKVVFAVHNFDYQGTFKGQQHFTRLGLPGRLLHAFTAPVTQAAQATAKFSDAVSSAAAAAVSSVGSQLAALVEALQRLGRRKPAEASGTGTSNEPGSSYGLLASVQELLLQAFVQAATEEVALAALDAQQHAQHTDQQDTANLTCSSEAAAGEGSQAQQQSDAAADDTLVLNWLAAGIAGSDAVVTVSPAYAQEMLGLRQSSIGSSMDSASAGSSRPTGSLNSSMEALLAAKQLRGILNGLDTTFWDPEADPLLPASVRFSSTSVQHGKAAAKKLLQRRLGLVVDHDAPLFAFVGRLTAQKGVDVLLAAMPQVLQCQQEQQGVSGHSSSSGVGQQQCVNHPAGSATGSAGMAEFVSPRHSSPQLVLLGAGERWMEHVLGQLAMRYPGCAVGVPDFNEPLAHLIMAGADFLVVPSRFEPCGLVALAGLRYGAVPIATATGGLADIVSPAVGYQVVNPGPEGDTAGFRKGAAELVAAMKRAAAEYQSPAFEAKRAAAMAVDVSWDAPCAAWEQLLLQLAEQQTPAVDVEFAATGDRKGDVSSGVEEAAVPSACSSL